jgi:hypothetical protein
MSGYDEVFERFNLCPDVHEDRLRAIDIWIAERNGKTMAQLGQTFDANSVPLADDFQPLPVGDYRVEIVQSEMRTTKDGNGQYLWLEMAIIDGEYANRKIWDRLNLINGNQQAVEIAQRTLSSICHAVGKMTVDDSEELHQIPFVAKARLVPDKQRGGVQNAFSYKAEGDAAPAKPAARPAAPAARPAPAAAAKPVGAPAGKPWERAKRA